MWHMSERRLGRLHLRLALFALCNCFAFSSSHTLVVACCCRFLFSFNNIQIEFSSAETATTLQSSIVKVFCCLYLLVDKRPGHYMHGQAAQFRVRCVQVGLPDGARERERKRRGGHNKFVCIRLAWLRPIQLQLQLQIQLHLHHQLQLQLWLRPDLSIQSSSATAERQFQLEM